MYDIIIIGAGPAGLSSAIYALRANKKVLILEKNIPGGQIINTNCIENYPGIPSISGFDYVNNLLTQVKNLHGELKYEEVVNITKEKEVTTTKNTYQAKSIIIATGLERNKLGIEDNIPNVSYCATCDGAFYKNSIVAVVGSGDQAVNDCIYLSNIVEKVYLIVRGNKLKSALLSQDKLKELNNVEVLYNTTITKLNSTTSLESITLSTGVTLEVKGLFIAIGLHPNNDIFKDLIELDEYGYIKSTDGVHTNIEGIYVAGDTRVKDLRQLITAASDGASSATVCIEEMK